MINQDHVQDMLNLSNPANMSGRKMFVMDGGNMMTAINWFKKITGQPFLFPIPVPVKVAGGEGYEKRMPEGAARVVDTPYNYIVDEDGETRTVKDTHKGFVLASHADAGVTVTLRGGSSSVLDGAWGTKHDGPPTIEIQNAQKLTNVAIIQRFNVKGKKGIIVEVKFTTRADQTRVPIK